MGDCGENGNDREGREEATEEVGTEGEADDNEDYFSPEKGNIAFASAHDGWAFRTSQFAAMYATKLGGRADPDKLNHALWGDFSLEPKTRRIVRIKASQRGKLRPLFVQV